MTNKPTCEEIWNEEGFEKVDRQADTSWRHGAYITEVYKRLEDETYWRCDYQLSTDGETHGLREGNASIKQVFPKLVTVTVYEPLEERAA